MFGHKKNKPPRTHIGPMRVHKTRNVMLLISIGFVGLYTLIDISLAYLNIKFSGLPQLNDTLTEKLFDYATWIVTSGATITVVKTIKGSTNSDSDEFEMLQNNTDDISSVDDSDPMESTMSMEEDDSPSDSDLIEDETEEEPEEENEAFDSSIDDDTNTVFNVNNISKIVNDESLEKIIGGAGKMNGKKFLQSIEELANKFIKNGDKDTDNLSDDASIDDLVPDDESNDYTIDEESDNSDETVALVRDENTEDIDSSQIEKDASTDDIEPLDGDASIDDLEPLEESDIVIDSDADQEYDDTEETSNNDENNELSDEDNEITADLDDGIDVTEEIDDNNLEKLNQALNLRDVESMAPDIDMPDSDYFNITDDEIENFKNMVEANKKQSKSLPSYKKQKIGEILMEGNYVKSKNPERKNVYYNLDELSKFQIALLKFIGEI